MPVRPAFEDRLTPELPAIAEHFGTPFHIYDEAGIVATVQRLLAAFEGVPFREYFAVKALPNPAILRLLHGHGLGFDCSSIAELELVRRAGAEGDEIFFTSNNTTREEFALALALGAIVNVDDVGLLDKLPAPPRLLSFRFNPGAEGVGDLHIGAPLEAKFGLRHDQLVDAVAAARELGVERFGLHAMVASNVLEVEPLLATLTALLELCAELHEAVGVEVELVNAGGGLGIPYRPEEAELDLEGFARGAADLLAGYRSRHRRAAPALSLEAGRYVTGPHGVLVTRVINRMSKWRDYVGVDAGQSALMRPALYGAYHHLTLVGDAGERPLETVDVVGALCENSDKFARQRELPRLDEGDLVMIHDTGAHGHSMGFTYNGRLRPQELLLRRDGSVELIRRAEEVERDHFATLTYEPDVLPARERVAP
ncbi:MAG TPA: diaminopimelate decarboxylase [Thermoleophilaceae bacterium]